MMNTCNLASRVRLCQRLRAIACNIFFERNLDLRFVRVLEQPRPYDDASPLSTAHHGARYVLGLFSSRLPEGHSRCSVSQHSVWTKSGFCPGKFFGREMKKPHCLNYSCKELPMCQERSSKYMWVQQRNLCTTRGRLTGAWRGDLREGKITRLAQSQPGPTLTQKGRSHHVTERPPSQGSHTFPQLPWMTGKRPYYLADCEKALKCLSGKLPETTSWDQFLDIGCGAGDLTRGIVKEFGGRHRVVVATERSWDVVKVLRRNSAQRDIAYEVLDVENDVTEALRSWGPFRRIFSFFHLESVRDKQRALANMRQLLWEDGGELFLLFRVQSNLQPLYKVLAEDGRWRQVVAEYDLYPKLPPGDKSSSVIAEMLNTAGFLIKQSKVLKTDWRLSTTEPLDELIKNTSPVLHRVPPEEREDFVRDCAHAASLVLPRSGDELTFSYTTFMAWAVVDPAKTASGSTRDTLASFFFGHNSPPLL